MQKHWFRQIQWSLKPMSRKCEKNWSFWIFFNQRRCAGTHHITSTSLDFSHTSLCWLASKFQLLQSMANLACCIYYICLQFFILVLLFKWTASVFFVFFLLTSQMLTLVHFPRQWKKRVVAGVRCALNVKGSLVAWNTRFKQRGYCPVECFHEIVNLLSPHTSLGFHFLPLEFPKAKQKLWKIMLAAVNIWTGSQWQLWLSCWS